jgi:hypothetical protein
MSEPDYDFLEEDVPDEAAAESVPETVESNTAPEVVAPAPAAAAPEATTAPAKEDHVPLAALMAERDKRQKEEASRKELERRLAELERPRQPPPPAFYENPEQHIAHAVTATEQRLQQRFFAALEEQARAVHADYDEALVELEQAGNPALFQQVFAAANPASEAYRLGKQLREVKAMQDPAAYRAKVEAEVRAAIAAEASTKEAARIAAQSAIPPELSSARASKDADAPAEDDSLDSILASRNKR